MVYYFDYITQYMSCFKYILAATVLILNRGKQLLHILHDELTFDRQAELTISGARET